VYGSGWYPICMVKTTVYLPEDLKQRLEQAASRSGQSEATIIRSALERWLESLLPRPTPHWGTIDFGDPDLAYKVDEVLAEGFGEL
jgi:Ribbon-helix-helix protein, copG family